MANVANLGGYGDASGAGLMFRNKLINGGFDIWQRATSSTGTTGIVSADRWTVESPNTNTSRSTFTLGQTTVPNNPKYHMTVTRTVTAGSANGIISQRMEFPEHFSGATVSISFWAKAAASKTIVVDFLGIMNGVTVIDTAGNSAALTTSWQKFEFTETFSNFASGATSAADDYLSFRFIEASNFSTFTIDIANVQVEFGSICTPFEFRPLNIELGLCYRYLYVPTNSGIAGDGAWLVILQGLTTTVAAGVIPLFQPMRAKPTITPGALGNYEIINALTIATPSAILIASTGTSSNIATFEVQTASSYFTVNGLNYLRYASGTAGAFVLSAEL